MIHQKKKIFTLISCIALLLLCMFVLHSVPTKAADSEPVASGSCGDNASWTLDSEGLLTISGTGAVSGWTDYKTPWFDNNSSIKSVIIESGITSIGSYAFSGCSKLTTATMPSTLVSIGDNVFRNCYYLKKADIPSSVKEIGHDAFYSCLQLSEVIIPDGITKIDTNTFYGCQSLINVVIPDSVTSIGNYTFYQCSKLPEITLPRNLTSIGDDVFVQCNALTEVTIPNKVTTIGVNAFANCPGLTELIIPDSVTSIGVGAFSVCTNLTTCVLPKGLTALSDNLFANDHKLTGLKIPSTVTSIGKMAFFACNALDELELPSGLTSLGDSVFAKCTTLKSIEIPDGVTSLGVNVFQDCSALESIKLPKYLSAIGKESFYNCTSLKSIVIPDGVTSLERNLLRNCTSLTSVTLPDTLTKIVEMAFYGCSALPAIEIPENVNTMGQAIFKGCVSLEELNIPKGVTVLPVSLCEGCSSLSKVSLPTSIEKINALAFSGCAFSEINISKKVTYIASGAFRDCNNLTDVYYGGTAANRANIEILANNDPLINATWHYAIPVESISLNESEIILPILGSYQLTASITPASADNQKVNWMSNDETVATVDENGLVTTHKYGSAVITAVADDSADGSIKASCTVKSLFGDAMDSAKYYYNPIYWAADNGITMGYSSGEYAGKFGVGLNCTRGELMVFLWRASGSKTGYGDARSMFNDVTNPATSAFNKAIAWGYKTGIVKGYADGGFHPNDPIVRKDVMIMLYRVAGKPPVSGTVTFTDVIANGYKKTSDTYKAILWGTKNKITNGYSSGPNAGQFGCLLNCQRQDIVTFLYRYDKIK